jgi:Probable cobalt transporter subunit (CbtA)
MVRTFLVRGMLVGVVAGLLSFAFLKVFGEPQVDRAITFEQQRDEAKAAAANQSAHTHEGAHAQDDLHGHNDVHAHDADEPELVSRPVQAGLGLFTAVMVYCAAFGGLFGLAFAFAYGRMPGAPTPQAISALLAAAGFVAIYLVPNLKYPANPPAVGEPETIGVRTALYFVMIAISLVAMVGRRRSSARSAAASATGTPTSSPPPATSWSLPWQRWSFQPSTKSRTDFRRLCCGNSASPRSARNS